MLLQIIRLITDNILMKQELIDLFKNLNRYCKNQIMSQGGSRFLYSFRQRKSVKSGIYNSNVKYKLPSLLVLTVAVTLGWGSYFVFNNGIAAVADYDVDGIGGVGQIDKKFLDPNGVKVKAFDLNQIQEDEKRKDALLGIQSGGTQVSAKDKKPKNQLHKVKYRVRPGDTIGSVAKKFNVSVASIAGSSNLRIVDEIHVGQLLYIPSREGFFYKIKRGDRLANVLIRYKVPLKKFLAANFNKNPDLLEVGEDIFLPGAKPKNIVRGWFIPTMHRIITSGYGWRSYPRRSFHKGLDLKAMYAPIRAARSGKITFRGWLGGYGKAIIIQHPSGYKTLYAHLSRIYVKQDQVVKRGHVIARSGNTGFSFGPHLHFEVTHNGKTISPHRILKGLRYSKSLTRARRHRRRK